MQVIHIAHVPGKGLIIDCFDADELWTAEGHSKTIMHILRQTCICTCIPVQFTLIDCCNVSIAAWQFARCNAQRGDPKQTKKNIAGPQKGQFDVDNLEPGQPGIILGFSLHRCRKAKSFLFFSREP